MRHSTTFARVIGGVIALLLAASLANTADAAKIYFRSYDAIERATTSGENVEKLFDTGPLRKDLAIDFVHDKVYWDAGLRLYRANFDETEKELLYESPNFWVGAVAVDPDGGRVYWSANHIFRANLDGSGREIIVVAAGARGTALDLVNDKLYWTAGDDGVLCANLDGSAVELLVPGVPYPEGIAVDPTGGKIYWLRGGFSGSPAVQRANLDGTNVEDLITGGLGFPQGVALDLIHGKVYWTDSSREKIQRANLDGSELEDVLTRAEGLDNVYGIVLAVEGLCGDSVLHRFEECDDGNTIDGDGCQGECALPLCGDGILDAGEECDDDYLTPCDGCSPTCTVELGLVCGDGILNTTCGEECDDGNTIDGDGCQGDCLLPFCGDGILDADEDCDDGNLTSCDGCSSSCEVEIGFLCGDGVQNSSCGEECDDGNSDSCDGCSASCKIEPGVTCGDGIVNPLCEECDDGNVVGGDSCEADCTLTPGQHTVILYDQTNASTFYGTPDIFAPSDPYANSQPADDFRIGWPNSWAIREVRTIGEGYGDPDFVNVAFYRDSDGEPAASPVCSFPELTDYSNVDGTLTISLPFPCTVDPGTYWISQQVSVYYYGYGHHAWLNRSAQAGSPAVWRGYGTVLCEDWTPLSSCGVGGGNPDLLFEIRGALLPGPTAVPGLGWLGSLGFFIALAGVGMLLLVRGRR